MTDTSTVGFAEAAARLGVTVRVLRRAIRAGRVPAPAAKVSAVTPLTTAWLEGVLAAADENPAVLTRETAQKVVPFARYPGTSAWRKYHTRVTDYYRFLAETAA
jgi:hypothetical protein